MKYNLEKVIKHLNFGNDDNFHYIEIIKRRKDTDEIVKKNSKIVKSYLIRNEDKLREVYPEIIAICNALGARAMITLNMRSYIHSVYKLRDKILKMDKNGNHHKLDSIVRSCCGESPEGTKECKRWVVDIDEYGDNTEKAIELLREFVEGKNSRTNDIIIDVIPSKSGAHVICNKFDRRLFQEFKTKHKIDITILEDGMLNLYIPPKV